MVMVEDSSERAGEIRLTSARGRVVLTTAVLGSAVAMLTATVVNVALPTFGTDLDASSAGQTRIVNGYTVTLASFALIGGTLGDRFGRVRGRILVGPRWCRRSDRPAAWWGIGGGCGYRSLVVVAPRVCRSRALWPPRRATRPPSLSGGWGPRVGA